MVIETSPQPSNHAPLLSRIISHLHPKSKAQTQNFPIDPRPPLRPSSLPLVLSKHTPNLALQGWTTVSFPVPSSECPSQHPLQQGFENLFESSKAFFDQPIEEKEKWKTKLGSEEGWSRIEGEKEFITIRTVEGTPEILRDAAKQCWAAAGDLMDGMLGRVSESLEMDVGEGEGGLRRFVGLCKRLGETKEDKTPTMLRLFRYEGEEAKIVAERKCDITFSSQCFLFPFIVIYNPNYSLMFLCLTLLNLSTLTFLFRSFTYCPKSPQRSWPPQYGHGGHSGLRGLGHSLKIMVPD